MNPHGRGATQSYVWKAVRGLPPANSDDHSLPSLDRADEVSTMAVSHRGPLPGPWWRVGSQLQRCGMPPHRSAVRSRAHDPLRSGTGARTASDVTRTAGRI